MWMLPISLENCLSIDKCFPINLCHQHRQRLKIELCLIELRWCLAQLKQLRVLIHHSIPCTIWSQTFADYCLYLLWALFRPIAFWPRPFMVLSWMHEWAVRMGKALIKQKDYQYNHSTMSQLTAASREKPLFIKKAHISKPHKILNN